MQCYHTVKRNVCRAHNAYDPALALSVFFGTSARKQTTEGTSSTLKPEYHGPQSQATEQANQVLDDTQSIRANARTEIPSQTEGTQDEESNRDKLPIRRLFPALKGGTSTLTSATSTWEEPSRIKAQSWHRHILWVRDSVNFYRGVSPTRRQQIDVEKMRAQLDYDPKVVFPSLSDAQSSMPIPWAVPKSEARGQNAAHILRQEIENFGSYMRCTPPEQVARQAVVDDATAFVDEILNSRGEAKTGRELFGSEKTGLALPLSDIDVRLFDISGRESHQEPIKMARRMVVLHRAMLKSDRFESVEYRSGHYPIIACRHRDSGLKIQFVCSPSTAPQQEITAQYLAADPHLKDLFVLIRTFFSMRGLLDVYHGGLGSYGTFVSILAALECTTPGQASQYASAPLRRYLAFYADLDTTRHAVAVRPRPRFMKHDRAPDLRVHSHAALRRADPVRAAQWRICQRSALQPYLLCLQDPANPMNDLGKRSHAIKHIQATVRYFAYNLWKNFRGIQVHHANGRDWPEESILTPLVGRCHELYHEGRTKLAAFGERVVEARKGGVGGSREMREGEGKNGREQAARS